MQKTWDEMYNFLMQQNNCRVNGQGFRVVNLQDFLEKLKVKIELHDPKVRNETKYCIILKETLEMVYNAYLTGNLEPANTRHYKPNSTFGG